MKNEKELSEMAEVFQNIYIEKKWVQGCENSPSMSGPGSFPDVVENWLERLKNFLEEKKITSVVDYGCGDFAVYKNF